MYTKLIYQFYFPQGKVNLLNFFKFESYGYNLLKFFAKFNTIRPVLMIQNSAIEDILVISPSIYSGINLASVCSRVLRPIKNIEHPNNV